MKLLIFDGLLTPAQIADKWALPSVPTHIVDVEAAGSAASVGYAAPNFGRSGGGLQIELLDRNARFTNSRPLPDNGGLHVACNRKVTFD